MTTPIEDPAEIRVTAYREKRTSDGQLESIEFGFHADYHESPGPSTREFTVEATATDDETVAVAKVNDHTTTVFTRAAFAVLARAVRELRERGYEVSTGPLDESVEASDGPGAAEAAADGGATTARQSSEPEAAADDKDGVVLVREVIEEPPIYKLRSASGQQGTWHASRDCRYLTGKDDDYIKEYTGEKSMPQGEPCGYCAEEDDDTGEGSEHGEPAFARHDVSPNDLLDALDGATSATDVASNLRMNDRQTLAEILDELGLHDELSSTGALDRATAEQALAEVEDAE